MLLLKLIILGIFLSGTSYCMSLECYTISESECPKFPEIPKDVEGLQNFCNDMIPLGNCTERVMEKCVRDAVSFDTEEDIEEFKETWEFVKSSCDNDSPIFKAIAGNIHCVSSTINAMDDICIRRELNHTTYNTLRNMMKDDKQPACLFDTWIFYCTTAKFDVECGNEVRNAVSEIISKTHYVMDYCKYMREKIPYIEEAFISEFRRGKSGEDALQGIMESISKMLE